MSRLRALQAQLRADSLRQAGRFPEKQQFADSAGVNRPRKRFRLQLRVVAEAVRRKFHKALTQAVNVKFKTLLPVGEGCVLFCARHLGGIYVWNDNANAEIARCATQ